MRRNRIYLLAVLSFFNSVVMAQQWRSVTIEASMMQYALPVSKLAGLFVAPVHFKGSVGLAYQWNKNNTHQLLQNASMGFGYHRFVQCIVPLNTECGYRYQSAKKLFFNIFVGGGYLHSIPLNTRYVLNNGVYEKTNKLGKPQGMVNARMGIGFLFKENAFIEISYENLLQTPFIKSYVPLLPYNIFNLRYALPFDTFKPKAKTRKPTSITPAF